MDEQPKKKLYKRWWFWVIIVFVGLWIIGSLGGSSQSSQQSSSGSTATQTNTSASTAQMTLTDIEYDQQLNENVIPFSTAYGSDARSLQTMLLTSDTADTLIYAKQAQSDLGKWKAGLRALEGKVPPDFVDINDSLNKAVDNYIKAINIIIADLNNGNTTDTSSSPYMTHGNLYMQQATTAIDQFDAKLKAE